MPRFTLLLFFLLGLIFVSFDIDAKEKIVDKSGRKPKWVKADETDLFRIKVKSQTLFAARLEAKHRFGQVLNSIVVHKLNAKSDSLKKARIADFLLTYHWSDIKGKAYEKIYGFQDTLLSDFYWEKIRLSKGGYLFTYNALFNCSSEEIEKIALQFENLDTRITTRLYPIKRQMEQQNSISWMFNAKDTLFSILEVAPQNYHGSILHLIEHIQSNLDLVEVKILNKDRSSIKFQLTIEGKVVPLDYTPKVFSTCAKMKNIISDVDSCTFVFDSRYCLEQDPESGFKIDVGSLSTPLRRSILLF